MAYLRSRSLEVFYDDNVTFDCKINFEFLTSRAGRGHVGGLA